jgi:hypothetical protein
MRAMGLVAIYPRQRTTVPGSGHKVYPYLGTAYALVAAEIELSERFPMGKAVVDATLASGRENEIVDALSWFLNGDKEMARHMLGIPLVVAGFFWLTLTFLPFLVALVSHDLVNSEIRNRSARFTLLRCTRSRLLAGKMMALVVGGGACLALGALRTRIGQRSPRVSRRAFPFRGTWQVVRVDPQDRTAAGTVERLADDLQITATAVGGRLARRLPAPSRYASNASAPTAPGRRSRLPAGVTAGICQVHPWVRPPWGSRLGLPRPGSSSQGFAASIARGHKAWSPEAGRGVESGRCGGEDGIEPGRYLPSLRFSKGNGRNDVPRRGMRCQGVPLRPNRVARGTEGVRAPVQPAAGRFGRAVHRPVPARRQARAGRDGGCVRRAPVPAQPRRCVEARLRCRVDARGRLPVRAGGACHLRAGPPQRGEVVRLRGWGARTRRSLGAAPAVHGPRIRAARPDSQARLRADAGGVGRADPGRDRARDLRAGPERPRHRARRRPRTAGRSRSWIRSTAAAGGTSTRSGA